MTGPNLKEKKNGRIVNWNYSRHTMTHPRGHKVGKNNIYNAVDLICLRQ